MKKVILAALFFWPLNVLPDSNFDTTDKVLLGASTVALVADWAQTRYIAKHPEIFYEQNPLLGRHPSTKKVDLYFVGAIVGNYLIAGALPSKYRKLWLGGVLAVEIGLVAHNRHIGIKFQF